MKRMRRLIGYRFAWFVLLIATKAFAGFEYMLTLALAVVICEIIEISAHIKFPPKKDSE